MVDVFIVTISNYYYRATGKSPWRWRRNFTKRRNRS